MDIDTHRDTAVDLSIEQSAAPLAVSGEPRLLRASEVQASSTTTSLHTTLAWMRDFIMSGHAELGRSGPVCPFAPLSLQRDTLWLAEVTEPSPSLEGIAAIIGEYRNLFLRTAPSEGPDILYKTFLVVFSALPAGSAGTAFVDEVQRRLKPHFVDMGLMLGEFHADNDTPGLHNPDFRPLRSPIPMLGIRHMVDSDLPFLTRQSDSARQRSAFLRSYLAHLGSTLSALRFTQALDALVAAEIEQWLDQAKAGQAPALAAMLRGKHRTEPALVERAS
jgi:hypothetical protein